SMYGLKQQYAGSSMSAKKYKTVYCVDTTFDAFSGMRQADTMRMENGTGPSSVITVRKVRYR
ncbi:MAG: hypothetical protein E6429_12895, partial [Staphylococcus sp.]|nr:hypothetical protein [Staphylococcus sp.]